jgi:hypothetical protein
MCLPSSIHGNFSMGAATIHHKDMETVRGDIARRRKCISSMSFPAYLAKRDGIEWTQPFESAEQPREAFDLINLMQQACCLAD